MKTIEHLKQLLTESGLNEAEVLLYTELLKKPATNIWELLNRCKLSKTTAYRAFERLENLKMISKKNGLINASSLKALVSELKTSQRNLGKLADKIQKAAPYLKNPNDHIENFEQFYTREQIAAAYIFMSEIDYSMCLDFGDFENFMGVLNNDISIAHKFRDNRIKKATSQAICTNTGPMTALFCTREAREKYKNYVSFANLNFKNHSLVFSDTSDYILFNNFEDPENPHSTLVKSRSIADFQRQQFLAHSQNFGKL